MFWKLKHCSREIHTSCFTCLKELKTCIYVNHIITTCFLYTKVREFFFFLTRNKTKQLIPALYFHNIYTHTYDIQVDYTLHIFTHYIYLLFKLKTTQWQF